MTEREKLREDIALLAKLLLRISTAISEESNALKLIADAEALPEMSLTAQELAEQEAFLAKVKERHKAMLPKMD